MKEYMGISIPRKLMEAVDPTIRSRGFTSRAEYIKYLIRKDNKGVLL